MPALSQFQIPPVVIKVLLTAGSILGILLVCILLILVGLQLLRVRAAREHAIRLTNQGNARSVYHLTVESPEPALKFAFLMNKIPLAEVPPPPPPAPVQSAQTIADQAHAQPPAAAHKTTASAAASPAGGVVKQGKKAGQEAAKKAGALAALLGAVGGLLPGKVGQKLKAGGAQAREVQTKTTRAVDAPAQMERRMEAVQKSSGQLGVPTSSGGVQATGGAAGSPAAEAVPAVIPASPAAAPALPQVYTVQTREVTPGETILLSLRIDTQKRRYPEGTFVYNITSQQMPLEKLNRAAPPITKQGSVYFKHVGAWRYWVVPLFNSLVIFSSLLAILLTVSMIWA